MNRAVLVLLGLTAVITLVNAHGRLIQPAGRATLWRYPEFQKYNPVPDYDDTQQFCGGFYVQYSLNGGNCGICGDPYHEPQPRAHEGGGIYGRFESHPFVTVNPGVKSKSFQKHVVLNRLLDYPQNSNLQCIGYLSDTHGLFSITSGGIITGNYSAGEVIEVKVDLTASHLGYFEFRLCPHNNPLVPATQECLDQNVLQLADGSGTRFPIKTFDKTVYTINLKLPENLTCRQCVLQWHYNTGNSHGYCPDGSYELGCGDQETFRHCADITIN